MIEQDQSFQKSFKPIPAGKKETEEAGASGYFTDPSDHFLIKRLLRSGCIIDHRIERV